MLRQLVFGLILVFITYSAFAECKKQISTDKVMVFVDLNGNPFELEQMKKSACQRGEMLKVLPTNHAELIKLSADLARARTTSHKACGKNGAKSKSCKETVAVANKAEERYSKLKSKSQLGDKEGIEKLVSTLDGENKKISQLTFSGHDGGGNFGGTFANVSKEEVREIFARYPKQRDSVQSLLLLGCYTGVTSEIRAWRESFPQAKLIAGYDGKGPLGDRKAGHTYIRDILQKEQSIVRESEEKKLYSMLDKGIEHINMITAAIYIEPFCGPEDSRSYYFRSSKKGAQRFRPFDDTGCLKIMHQSIELREKISPYITGETDIPTNTSESELRRLYDFSRENSHCFVDSEAPAEPNEEGEVSVSSETDHPMAYPDQLMMLLFYHPFKVNFARFYKDDLLALQQMIDNLDVAPYIEQAQNDKQAILKMLEIQKGLVVAQEKKAEQKYLNRHMKDLKKEIVESLGDDEEMKKYLDIAVFKDGEMTAEESKYLQDHNYDLTKDKVLEANINLYHQLRFYRNMDPKHPQTKEHFIDSVKFSEEEIVRIDKQLQGLATAKDDLKTKFWVPTEEAIKNKSRKEILQNLTVYNEILGIIQVYDQGDVIGKMTTAKDNMEALLNYRENVPFAWHEVSETVEPHTRIPSLFSSGGSNMDSSSNDQEQDPQAYEEEP